MNDREIYTILKNLNWDENYLKKPLVKYYRFKVQVNNTIEYVYLDKKESDARLCFHPKYIKLSNEIRKIKGLSLGGKKSLLLKSADLTVFPTVKGRSGNDIHEYLPISISNKLALQELISLVNINPQIQKIEDDNSFDEINEYINQQQISDEIDSTIKHKPITPEQDEKRRIKQAENGLEGEKLAFQFEIKRLIQEKCPEPSKYIKHVAKEDVGIGYDICTTWGITRYIEVKTSANGSDGFFISSNEVKVLTYYGSLAWIYLVDLSKKEDIKNCIREINNPVDKFYKDIELIPIQYSATLLNLSS